MSTRATPLRILILEDRPDDADLMLIELRRAGFDPTWQRVESEQDYLAQLASMDPALDVILADYSLPQFNALRALHRLQERELNVPFIVVTGSISEEVAVECMKQGATDYLIKDRLGRLGQAVRRALAERQVRAEKWQAEAAQRESEARYRAVSELTSDYAYALAVTSDGALVCEWVTEAFARISGFALDEMTARGGWTSLVHPDDRSLAAQYWRVLLAGQSESSEFRIVTKSGETRLVRDHGRPVWDEALGRVGRIYGAAQDITERKRLEDRLRQAQKMEAIGRFAGGIAHDFNNVLTVVGGQSELLLRRLEPSDARRKHVDEIDKAVERAAALTRQLLAFSRPQALVSEVLDLNTTVVDMERLLRRLTGDDVELAMELASELGRVKADPGQIERIIMNLAVNARDAMPGGGRVTITTTNVTLEGADLHGDLGLRPGPYVMLAVSDTGIGMDAETVSRVFEPFFTTKEAGKGTGLGLSIVYGTVQQSNGHIEVDSEPGRGTTFRIYLPRIEDTARTDLVAAGAGPIQQDERAVGSRQ